MKMVDQIGAGEVDAAQEAAGKDEGAAHEAKELKITQKDPAGEQLIDEVESRRMGETQVVERALLSDIFKKKPSKEVYQEPERANKNPPFNHIADDIDTAERYWRSVGCQEAIKDVKDVEFVEFQAHEERSKRWYQRKERTIEAANRPVSPEDLN